MTNYYDVLGVEKDASDSLIRDRFRVLARELHPDRIRDEVKKREAEVRFQQITEAVNVLTNPARRKVHDFELEKKTGGSATDPKEVAKVYLAKGVKSYKEGDFLSALQSFDMSVKHYGNDAKALHYLALACQKVTGQVRKGVDAIEGALRLDPNNATFRRDAGRLYHMAGLTAKAERQYEEVLKWYPEDAEAKKALAEIRGQTDSKSRFGGLFGRKG